jgi:hypothetical protein
MANFFAELKRRHIYRVAAAYAVVAWVLHRPSHTWRLRIIGIR